jgi:hypothetical protein
MEDLTFHAAKPRRFDWRKAESAMNAYEQYQIQVDDVPVHFMRKPGVGPNPTPLIRRAR